MTPRPTGVKIFAVALTTLVAVGLTACGDDSSSRADDPAGRSALSLADLDGRVFAASQVAGHPLVDETVVRVGFSAGQVAIDAGCNHLTGTAALDGDRLTVTHLASTEIGCEQDRADQDTWIADFIAHGPKLTLDGDTLTLVEGDVSMALAEQDVPDSPSGGSDDPDGSVTSNG